MRCFIQDLSLNFYFILDHFSAVAVASVEFERKETC